MGLATGRRARGASCACAIDAFPSEAPNHVVTLVHGTFAAHANWMQPTAPLPDALEQPDTIVLRFCWSGRNRQVDRLESGRRLHDHLLAQIDRFPDSAHHVIAHSHGGNVALYAMRDGGDLDERLADVGVVTLATPFVVMRDRPAPGVFALSLIVLVVAAAWAVIGTSIGTIRWGTLGAFNIAIWSVSGAAGLAVLLAMAVSAKLYSRIEPGSTTLEHLRGRSLRRAIELITVPTLPTEQLVVIRPAADEASGLLGFAQVASWVWWKALRALNYASGTFSLGRQHVIDAANHLRRTRGLRLLIEIPLALLRLWILFVLTALIAFFSLLTTLALAIPLAAALILTNAPFGVDTLFWNIYGHLSMEATPPGVSLVAQVRNVTGDSMAHGVYEDPEAIRLAVEAVRGASR